MAENRIALKLLQWPRDIDGIDEVNIVGNLNLPPRITEVSFFVDGAWAAENRPEQVAITDDLLIENSSDNTFCGVIQFANLQLPRGLHDEQKIALQYSYTFPEETYLSLEGKRIAKIFRICYTYNIPIWRMEINISLEDIIEAALTDYITGEQYRMDRTGQVISTFSFTPAPDHLS